MTSHLLKSKAFGIIEVMISSTVIIVILMALTSVGRQTLATSGTVQNRAQAMFLAQEEIERIRQLRDTYWIDGDSNTNWSSLTGVVSCSTACHIAYNSGTSQYNISSGDEQVTLAVLDNATAFTRSFKLVDMPTGTAILPGITADYKNQHAVKVVASVSWGSQSVTAETLLTDWRPNF